MRVKPKEVMVNLPVVLLFNNEDDIPELCSNFNTFLHGKVKLKYEILGTLNEQYVGLFYLQRNNESQELRDEFVRLIEEEQVIRHQQNAYFATLTREMKESCGCACHSLDLESNCMDCNCGPEKSHFHIMEK